MILAWLIFFPILSAPLVYCLGRRREDLRFPAAALVTGGELALALTLAALLLSGAAPRLEVPYVLGGSGLLFLSDGFRGVYALISALMWFFTTLFSREYFAHERQGLDGYCFFLLLTLGFTQGVMLSGDFLSAFVFFELLSLSSLPWVIHSRSREAIRAAKTYLAVTVIGGLILLMGLLLLRQLCGTLTFSALAQVLPERGGPMLLGAGICILLGFGAKAGMFPLHVWLPMAHPVAPAPASALLSGVLTKVGVYGMLMLCLLSRDRTLGQILLVLGLVTMALGAVLAVFSVNLKRTLACSSMSQIGFILTGLGCYLSGTGEETRALALTGALLHMVNHSLLKLLLFLCAGAAAMNAHSLSLEELRGWGRNKPLLHGVFLLGAAGISGVPGLNGYLSKTLLHEGLTELAAECMGGAALALRGAEALFLCSGGLTFAYMLKLYLCLFWERNREAARQAAWEAQRNDLTPLSAAVLLCSALLLPPLGQKAAALPLGRWMSGERLEHFALFSWESLEGALISLGFGLLVYLAFIRPVLCPGGRYVDRWDPSLDLEDRLYRPLLLRHLPEGVGALARVFGENLLLRPLCRGFMFAATLFGRVLDSSVDGLVLLLHGSLLREEQIRDGSKFERRTGRAWTFIRGTSEAFNLISENLSFAMLMTCLGVMLVLVTLAFVLQS